MGTISWAIQKWCFVELENTVEWFVSLERIQAQFWGSKRGSFFEFDEGALSFFNPVTGKKFAFGQSIKIKVESVDEINFRIDFSIIE